MRQSGRTTRMLQAALKQTAESPEVVVLAANEGHAIALSQRAWELTLHQGSAGTEAYNKLKFISFPVYVPPKLHNHPLSPVFADHFWYSQAQGMLDILKRIS